MADENTPIDPMAMAMQGIDHLKSLAHDYAVPMSHGTLQQIAGDALAPEKVKAFEEYIKTAAQGLYPTLAPQIKAGIPTAYLLDPYRQVAKQVLGEDHEPDFMGDPKSSAALSGGMDPATGRPAPMSLDQWKGHLMSHPGFGYDQTQQAQETIANALQGMFAQMSQPQEGM
jgi:hypothetical protein